MFTSSVLKLYFDYFQEIIILQFVSFFINTILSLLSGKNVFIQLQQIEFIWYFMVSKLT